MPNWVNNVIYFNGDKNQIKKVFNKIIVDGQFDFNTIVPRSKDLDVVSGSITDIATYVYVSQFGKLSSEEVVERCEKWELTIPAYIIERITEEDFTQENYDLGSKYVNNFINYGCRTWYEWNIQNWGTKWNAQNTYYLADQGYLSFHTAWSCPVEILEKLAEVCRNYGVGFDGYFCDEDYTGYNNGKFYTDGFGLEVICDLSGEDRILAIQETWGLDWITDEYDFETNTPAEGLEWFFEAFTEEEINIIKREIG